MKIGGWAPHELHRPRGRGGGARSGGRRPPGVCRRDARARSARRAGARRRAVGGRLVRPAQSRAVSADGVAPRRRRAVRRAPRSSRRTRCCSGRTTSRPAPATVCPGQHTFDEGYSVVWWDPNALTLDREADLRRPSRGSHRQGRAEERDRRRPHAYDRWNLARARRACGGRRRVAGGRRPLREWAGRGGSVRRGRRAGADGSAAEDLVEVVNLTREPETRPGGTAFGLLVHDLLARAPFGSPRSALVDLAVASGARAWTATRTPRSGGNDRRAPARRTTCWRARAPREARGACRRETPVTCTLPDGTMVEGVVDLAFEESGALDRRRLQDRPRARHRRRSNTGARCRSTRRRSRRRPVSRRRGVWCASENASYEALERTRRASPDRSFSMCYASIPRRPDAHGPSNSSSDSGSTRAPLARTAQCRCGPVTRPVAPTRPTTSSRVTGSPSCTSG